MSGVSISRSIGRSPIKVGRKLSLSLSIFTIFAFTSFARAEFLEDLFGAGNAAEPHQSGSQSSQPQQPAEKPRAPSGPKRGRVTRPRGAENAKPIKAALCYPNGAARRADKDDALFHDETLRPGDSVMMAEGVRVFQGGSSRCPHEQSEFLTLAEVHDLPKAKRGVLIAIERATRRPRDLEVGTDPGNAAIREAVNDASQTSP